MTTAPYQLLPELSVDEYGDLLASVALYGILEPIVVDEDGAILDGHHRKAAADELGIPCPSRTIPALSEVEKRTFVLTVNLDRRHLGREQRKAIHLALRAEGMSTRAIAEATGSSKSAVDRDLGSGVPSGTPADSGRRVVGSDGKSYPASRPTPEPEPPASVEPEWPEPESEPEPGPAPPAARKKPAPLPVESEENIRRVHVNSASGLFRGAVHTLVAAFGNDVLQDQLLDLYDPAAGDALPYPIDVATLDRLVTVAASIRDKWKERR